MKPLPKPLPLDVMEAAVPNETAEKTTDDEDKEVYVFSRQELYFSL